MALGVALFVSVDIANDKVRRKASEMLLDYGLIREQYSVFVGRMTRNRREELYVRLRIKLREQFGEDEAFGRVVVVPVSEREAAQILRFQLGAPRKPAKKKKRRPSVDDQSIEAPVELAAAEAAAKP